MYIQDKFDEILLKAQQGNDLNREEAKILLNIHNNSDKFYKLLGCSNLTSRKAFNNNGKIFAQIGINSNPCSKNCDFCSLGEKHKLMGKGSELSEKEVMTKVKDFVEAGANEIFLMTTADYSFDKFIEISKKVKNFIPEDMRLIANIGDFSENEAEKLIEAGFVGVYHICRLREGTDTSINPEIRMNTLNVIKNSKLELYYCVEPIGPEHTIDEIVDQMFIAKDYNVSVMAVMRRIPVIGTPLDDKGQITELELAKIAAVTRLVVGNSIRAMGVHEPSIVSLLAGANQIYAETGINPRDTVEETSKNRGFSVYDAQRMLKEAEYNTNITK